MPDPGIGNPDFGRPTANLGRGPRRGRMARKRLRPPIKVPGEYAEFRLEDGQLLIDVLGEEFFGPDSGHVTEEEREELRVGNYQMVCEVATNGPAVDMRR